MGSLGKLGNLRVRRIKEESACIHAGILAIRRVKHLFLLKQTCCFQKLFADLYLQIMLVLQLLIMLVFTTGAVLLGQRSRHHITFFLSSWGWLLESTSIHVYVQFAYKICFLVPAEYFRNFLPVKPINKNWYNPNTNREQTQQKQCYPKFTCRMHTQ